MPTNFYRNMPKAKQPSTARKPNPHAQVPHIIDITIGLKSITAQLADTTTAQRFWNALPLFSVAETWGETIHFEIPVPTGRDRTARINARKGDICFWTSDNRVIIAFGPSPISRPGEIRLPQLCNIFAKAIDDPSVFKSVIPGEKVTIKRSSKESGSKEV